MGFLPNLRTGSNQEDLPNSSGSSPINNSKKRWVNFMPLFVTLVVIAEIALLGRLDISENAALVNSWADSFYQFTSSSPAVGGDEVGFGELDFDRSSESETCEQWLEREDSVVYSRDFHKEPISVTGGEQEFKSCAVGCKFGSNRDKKPDAAFGLTQQSGTARVLRSMESSHYYPENNIARARGRGFDIIMTTSLSSNVPVGYFSWAEYDFMAPLQPKTERALAAAFISNCGARNLRLQTLEALEKAHVDIDSYGGCHRNRDGNGSVPVVVGAPNIQDFAPSHDSVLHIRELQDVDSVAKTMKYLAENPGAYNQSLRWKFEGPSDSFKALVDMAAVHSSCRLCIYLATMAHEKEEKSAGFPKRPCKCMRGLETVYHIYVRERGRFQMESIFLRLSNLTMEAMESAVILKFRSRKHIPVWKQERPESIRGGDELKVYRIYPLGKTQRQALYTFRFKSDGDLRSHIESNPCAKFEVIFV